MFDSRPDFFNIDTNSSIDDDYSGNSTEAPESEDEYMNLFSEHGGIDEEFEDFEDMDMDDIE